VFDDALPAADEADFVQFEREDATFGAHQP
jgi:hypothetical protein